MLYNFVLHYDGHSEYYQTKSDAYSAFNRYRFGGWNSIALFRRNGEIIAKCEFGKTTIY